MNDRSPNLRHPRARGYRHVAAAARKRHGLRAAMPARAGMTKLAAASAFLLLAACATQTSSAIAHTPTTPGFLLGLWHGFIFPVAWVLSLVMPDVAVYAVPNTGGWYDFGYFVGIVFFGVGARSTRTVYVTRRVRR